MFPGQQSPQFLRRGGGVVLPGTIYKIIRATVVYVWNRAHSSPKQEGRKLGTKKRFPADTSHSKHAFVGDTTRHNRRSQNASADYQLSGCYDAICLPKGCMERRPRGSLDECYVTCRILLVSALFPSAFHGSDLSSRVGSGQGNPTRPDPVKFEKKS